MTVSHFADISEMLEQGTSFNSLLSILFFPLNLIKNMWKTSTSCHDVSPTKRKEYVIKTTSSTGSTVAVTNNFFCDTHNLCLSPQKRGSRSEIVSGNMRGTHGWRGFTFLEPRLILTHFTNQHSIPSHSVQMLLLIFRHYTWENRVLYFLYETLHRTKTAKTQE